MSNEQQDERQEALEWLANFRTLEEARVHAFAHGRWWLFSHTRDVLAEWEKTGEHPWGPFLP